MPTTVLPDTILHQYLAVIVLPAVDATKSQGKNSRSSRWWI